MSKRSRREDPNASHFAIEPVNIVNKLVDDDISSIPRPLPLSEHLATKRQAARLAKSSLATGHGRSMLSLCRTTVWHQKLQGPSVRKLATLLRIK